MTVYVRDRALTIEAVRDLPKAIEVTFEEITTPEEVRTLTNEELFVDRADLPPLEDGEYYLSELVGLTVKDEQGGELGTVRDLVEAGAQTFLEVRPRSGAAVLVPANEHFIVKVVAGSHVVIAAPDGMFDGGEG